MEFGGDRVERMDQNPFSDQIRSAAWSKYLFSGLLVCGECGARITIVAGKGKRAYPKYDVPTIAIEEPATTACSSVLIASKTSFLLD